MAWRHANSAIFSVVDAVLLRRLPYRDVEQLVVVWADGSAHGMSDNLPATPGTFLALGLLAALAMSRLLAGLLYGVGPGDPVTLGAVAAALLGLAGVASLLPALRAMRIDPVVALRD